MILSGKEIKRRINRDIEIQPFCESRLNPNSYNLRLHDTLYVYENPVLNMTEEQHLIELKIPKAGLILDPKILYLGRTIEYTETDNLVPMLEGRSSIGRLGINIHATAGFGDVGFKGYWTLEISCVQPVRIYAGAEICQCFYHTIEGDFDRYEKGKYQQNTGVQGSKIYKEFE